MDQKTFWASISLLVLLASLPFWQVAAFDFLNYDDPLHVTKQPAVLAGATLDSLQWALTATPSNLWHPLTWWSFIFEVEWLGGGADAPQVHHVTNLLLHLANSALFLLLLRVLKIPLAIGFAASLAFAMHPLHVEPVAWISARKDLLSGFFSLLSLLAYVRHCRLAPSVSGWGLLSLVAALAAMVSKPVAVVLPVLLVLLDFIPQGPETEARAARYSLLRLLVEKWLFFLMAIGLALISIKAQYAGSLASDIGQQDLLHRLADIPAKLAFYIQHLLWPLGLSFEYSPPEGLHFWLLSGVGLALLISATWVLITQARRHPALWISVAWFLVCLLPMLGLVYAGGDFTADRYTYLALAGPLLGLALWMATLSIQMSRVATGVLVTVALLLGGMSHQQASYWKNDLALFLRGVEVQPRSATAHTNLAGVYRLQGDNAQALHHYQTALGLDSKAYIVNYNMAAIHRQQGNLTAAIDALQASLQSHPGYARSHRLLGQLLDQQAQAAGLPLPAAGLEHARRAFEIEPHQYDTALVYAGALANRGRNPEAARVLSSLMQQGGLTPGQLQHLENLQRKLR